MKNIPILKSNDIRLLEQKAEESGVSLETLMERAGFTVTDVIQKRFSPQKTLILCGPGNNGGDGYVVARLLKKAGWDVTVATARGEPPESNLALEKYREWGTTISNLQDIQLEEYKLIIDAFFGIGLIRPLQDPILSFVQKINNYSAPIISIDIPSGVQSDTGEILAGCVEANITVTFNFYKPGHFLLPGGMYKGELILADIGLPSPENPKCILNHPNHWQEFLPQPTPLSHKYKRGHLAIIAGKEMTGATRLAAVAARRVGVGLVSILTPPEAQLIYSLSDPGHIVRPFYTHEDLQFLLDTIPFSAFCIGPGLPLTNDSQENVKLVLNQNKSTLLDAGALMNFEKNPALLFSNLHKLCVLTPHEGEFKKLFDLSDSKLGRVLEIAQKLKVTLLLKGGDTIIANAEGDTIIDSLKAPYLATAGTGDVLSGLIAGLLAQGVDGFWAAAIGNYLQRKAGHILGPGLIAEDISPLIPSLLKEILVHNPITLDELIIWNTP